MASRRVGGSFWAAQAIPDRPVELWIRQRKVAEARARARAALRSIDGKGLLVSLPATLAGRQLARELARNGVATSLGDVDPWPLIDAARTVEVAGDDEVGFLALVAGKNVRCTGGGPISGRGLTDDAASVPARTTASLPQLASLLLVDTVAYRDPFTGNPSDAESTVELLSFWREQMVRNRPIVAGAGIARWKRREVGQMLWNGGSEAPRLTLGWRSALRRASRDGGAIVAWPSRTSARLHRAAAGRSIPVYQVEDGFVRSVGLGSDCYPPLSVVVDRRGIYYDAGRESDLEHLLATTSFLPELCARAEALAARIVASGIGKYKVGRDAPSVDFGGRAGVLVVGQVENDLSVLTSGAGVAGNLDLLRRARDRSADAFLIYRPHPDVDAGHRPGRIDDAAALRYADRVERAGSMAGLIEGVGAVHVLTSLAGFEALMRGKRVVTHGQPFYAGWGLTEDCAEQPPRRGRVLRLAELVAATLILYPRYLDPLTGLPCPPEVLLDRLVSGYRPAETVATRFRRLLRRVPGRGGAPVAAIGPRP